MKLLFINAIIFGLFSCGSIHAKLSENNNEVNSVSHDFIYMKVSRSFKLNVIRFYQNNAYCFTEGIPYALIIGKTNGKQNMPDTVSVLSQYNNNTYNIGDEITVTPLPNPENQTSMRKICFITDTVIDGSKKKWIVGSEYKATWGKIIEIGKALVTK